MESWELRNWGPSTGFKFDSIRRCFLSRAQDFLLFDAGIAGGESLGDDLGDGDLGDNLDENVGRDLAREDLAREPERLDGKPEGADADARARLPSTTSREDDERANSLGLVITAAMLFVLFAAATLFGSHGTIGSIPRPATSTPAPDGKAMGNFLYGARGAAACPQMSFDNATGSVTGPTERCLGRAVGAARHPHD